MAPFAGPTIALATVIALRHDLTFNKQKFTDARMLLSMNSIFLGDAKAKLYQLLSSMGLGTNDADKSKYASIQNKIYALEQEEKRIASQEKILDMKTTKIDNELKVCDAREESLKKQVDAGAKSFSYG